MSPKEILENARSLINEAANGDPDVWWYTNRFVFARLMLDERQTKTGVKKRLFESNAPCHYCGKPFESKKGVHLHRVDEARGYSDENCVLMHRECHQKYHSEEMQKASAAPVEESQRTGSGKAVLVRRSKLYEDMSFLYWWDITPNLAERLESYEGVEFVCKDTGSSCQVSATELKSALTSERQTSRGEGNWGIRVLNGHEDELAIEPTDRHGEWLFLPVEWSAEQT